MAKRKKRIFTSPEERLEHERLQAALKARLERLEQRDAARRAQAERGQS